MMWRKGSPVGDSILHTSAPQSASRAPVAGPAIHMPSSTTRTPVSGPIEVFLSVHMHAGACDGSDVDAGATSTYRPVAPRSVGGFHHQDYQPIVGDAHRRRVTLKANCCSQ